MERKTRDSPQKKGTSFKEKRPYRKFKPDSPPNELSVVEKRTLGKIKEDKRAIRNLLGLNPNFKKSKRYEQKKEKKELTKQQRKYDTMKPGPAKKRLKDIIHRKELLLSSTEHGSALELTDDDLQNPYFSDDADDKVPVQHAVAVPVVQGITLPRKLQPMKHLKKKTQKNPNTSPRRSQRRGVLERLADARKQEAILESKMKAHRRTKRAYNREEDQGDREDNDSGSESDDSWGNSDNDGWSTDDDGAGPRGTKEDETRQPSSTRGSASRKKKKKGKKERNKSKKGGKKKGKKGEKKKKGGKKTRRKS